MQVNQKWDVLSSVSDWVKYSDAKSTVILGFQGAVAGFFFTQRADFTDLAARYGCLTSVAFGVGVIALVLSILLAAVSIFPRLNVGESTSNIFFAHIAQLGSTAAYRARLAKPTLSFDEDVENQIWANSVVAWRKYQLISYSIVAGVVGYVGFGIAAGAGWIHIQ